MKIIQTLCLVLLFITFSSASHRRISNRVNQFFENSNNYVRSNRARDIASVDRAVGCKAAPTSWMYQFLNRICEDCFQLYRNTDLYHMCRTDCFGTDVFRACMDVLQIETEVRDRAAEVVDTIHHLI